MSDRVINLYFKKPFNGTIDVNNKTTLGTGDNSLIFTVSINDTNYIKMGNTKPAGTLTLPSDLLTAPTSNKPNLLLFEVSGGVFLSANTFSECSSLQMVDLYNMGNIFIPPTCFRNCTSLNTVIFPLGAASTKSIDISANAFAGCSSLTTLHFPSTNSGDIIHSSAFDNIPSTKRINLYDTTGTSRTNYTTPFSGKGTIVYGTNLRTIYKNANYTTFYSGIFNGPDFSYNSNFIDPSNNNAKQVTSGNTSVITVDTATGNTNVNIINAGLTFIKANTFVTSFTSLWPSALSVVYIDKANTTVSGTTSYNQPFNTPSQITLNLSSTGSGAITYTSNNTNLFTVSGTTATILGVGSGTITGTIAETSNYNAGSQVISLTITQLTTTISGTTSYSKTYNDAPFTLDLTSNSGGTIVYTSNNTNMFTVSGSTVTIVGLGSGTITGSITGTANYTSASQTINITVGKSTPIISVTTPAGLSVALTDKTYTYYQIVATSNNTDNSTITYSTSNPYIATVDQTGNVYILSTGTVTITLSSAPETTNFFPATSVNVTIYSSIKPSTSDLYTYKGTPLNEYLMIDTGYPADSSFNSAYNTEISNRYFSVIRKTSYDLTNLTNTSGERVLYIAADDSSYYSVINTGESITIELWVNLEELPNDDVCLIKKPKEYAVWVTQTSVRCYNYNTNSFTSATTSTNLNVGWKHIAFTYTNTNDNTNNASVYINGSLLFTCNLQKSTTALQSTDYFSIGDELGLLSVVINANNLVDRIFGAYCLRIWPNTIRTASEIESYYNVISPILGVDQYLLKEQTYTNSTNILNSNTSSSISYLTIKEFVVNGSKVDAITQSVWVNNNDYPLGYINHFIKYDSVNTGSKFEQTNYFKDINNTEYGAKYIQYVGNANSVRAGTSVANSSGDKGTDGSGNIISNIAIPSNCSSIRCIIIAGGGGGSSGEANNTNYGGSGGAAGGARYIEINNINVSTISITVGNGGQSNLSSNDYPGPGGNGASSSITIGNSTYGVNGGKGGARTARGYAIPTSGTTYDNNSNYTYTDISYIAGNITFPTGSARGTGLTSTFPNGNSGGPNDYPYNINSTGYGTGGDGGDSVGANTTPNDAGNFGTSGKGGFVRVYFMI